MSRFSSARRSGEPSPPIKAVMDLPLRHDVTEDQRARIDTLSREITANDPDGEWRPLYDDAIAIVEELVADIDETSEALRIASLEADDPNELKRRLTQEPRRAADSAAGDLRQAIQKAGKEWSSRARRQADYLLEECVAAAQRELVIEERPRKDGLDLQIDTTWWVQFSGYVQSCCDQWIGQATAGLDDDVRALMLRPDQTLIQMGGGQSIEAPAQGSRPANEARFSTGDVPRESVDIPSLWASLGRFIRSNVMAVGIFGTALAVGGVLIGKLFGAEGMDGINTMYVRGGLILAVLPISAVFGVMGAKKQRQKMRDDAIHKQKEALLRFIQDTLKRSLQRQREAVERWVDARVDRWGDAVDRYRDRVVEPRLTAGDDEAAEVIRDIKLQQQKTSEELSRLRSLKGKLEGNLLFDLKKRRRELEIEATAAPPVEGE